VTSTPEIETPPRLTTALGAARLAIRWERLWRALWAPVAVLVLFIGVALTGVLPLLPDLLHGALLALLAVLFGFTLPGLAGVLRPISGEEAARRVETSSGLKHRPLTALLDHPAQDKLTQASQSLWQAHVARAAATVEHLQMPTPAPGVAALDPRGLRFIPVLVLFVGVLMGWNNPTQRIFAALNPVGNAQLNVQARMDVWITPPAYTGLAPSVFSGLGATSGVPASAADNLAAEVARTLILPVGSEILVHAQDMPGQPSLRIGAVRTPMQQLGDTDSQSFKIATEIGNNAVGAERLSLMVGATEFAGWPVRIALDLPPSIEFERAPSKRRDTQLEVTYTAGDDYGIKNIDLTIRRANGRPVPGGEAEITVTLPLSGDRRALQASSARDFSAHPWAGLPVQVRLVATDSAGQLAETDAVEVVLPERIFNHPVARQLAEARKALNDPDPDVIQKVTEDVRQVSLYPMRFFDDTVAFLSLRIAYARLFYSEDKADIPSVQQLLWETALRIEDGEFALAEADLMRLQDEAMQALREGRIGEELDRVMQELQKAMDRYMQAMAERLEEMGMDQLPPMAGQQQMQSQDIQEMLDRIKELADTGNRDAAEQMLAQMQQMLEQLRQGMKMQQSNPAMAQAKKMMDQLRSLTEDQQNLLDRTFQESRRQGAMQRPQLGGQQPGQQQQGQQPGQQPGQRQGQQGEPGQQEGQRGQPSAADQQALRQRLGELMMQMDEALGQIPENLGRADQQMEQAGKNMGKGELRDATGNQTQALEELRQATNGMAEAMARQFGAQMGIARGNQPMPGGQGGFDPFGRQNRNENGQGTAVEEADVTLPDRMELRRSREILDELRRRSGDRARPPVERDYIDRLLDTF
jgi:uncharacterized protein (TIGR02302 family)